MLIDLASLVDGSLAAVWNLAGISMILDVPSASSGALSRSNRSLFCLLCINNI